MRWRTGRRSENIEDRRGSRMRMPAGRGIRLGGGGIFVILLLLLLGADPAQLLQLVAGGVQGSVQSPQMSPRQATPAENEAADFVSVLLADTEDVWTKLFSAQGRRYEKPQLVLFSGAVRSACGLASAASGPFYCPGDNKAYLDLSFFNELHRLGGKGDFAAAYVVAHEIGHHVQNVLGTIPKVAAAKARLSESEANALQVRVELQADCYAGVWAHHGNKDRKILEAGDIEEGMATAAAIGDDTLQRRAGRSVRPESFTHGSSKQRTEWFLKGFQSGAMSACDTI